MDSKLPLQSKSVDLLQLTDLAYTNYFDVKYLSDPSISPGLLSIDVKDEKWRKYEQMYIYDLVKLKHIHTRNRKLSIMPEIILDSDVKLKFKICLDEKCTFSKDKLLDTKSIILKIEKKYGKTIRSRIEKHVKSCANHCSGILAPWILFTVSPIFSQKLEESKSDHLDLYRVKGEYHGYNSNIDNDKSLYPLPVNIPKSSSCGFLCINVKIKIS